MQVIDKIKEVFNEISEAIVDAFAELRAIAEDIEIPAKKKYKPVKCIGFVRSAILPCKRQYKIRSCC